MGAVTPQDVKENDGFANMTNPMVGAAGFEPRYTMVSTAGFEPAIVGSKPTVFTT